MLCTAGRSTTIVGITTDDQVYLGADALISVGSLNAASKMCKISRGDNGAAAIAGHLGDAATSFDAARLLRRALIEPGDLLAKVGAFVRQVEGPLQQSLDFGRLHSPTVFSSKYAGKKVLQAMFGAIEGDGPQMIISTFRADEDGRLIADEPKRIGPGQVYVFGESAAIARYQRRAPDWNADAPCKIIRKFFSVEIDDEPKLVGGPVSILKISRGRQQWIEPGQCSSVQPPD